MGGCSQDFGLLPGFWSAPRVLDCSQDFGVAHRVLE